MHHRYGRGGKVSILPNFKVADVAIEFTSPKVAFTQLFDKHLPPNTCGVGNNGMACTPPMKSMKHVGKNGKKFFYAS
jgi:hypothetical protein